MYDAQSFVVENPIDRYDITDRMPLKSNKDGSLPGPGGFRLLTPGDQRVMVGASRAVPDRGWPVHMTQDLGAPGIS
jgi:hypothetical protein